MVYREDKVSDLVGKTLVKCENTGDIRFETTDGEVFVLTHHQDCCENVQIDDVCGDLNDLVGSPLIQAEEVSNYDGPEPGERGYDSSYTWTFYRFATAKGFVTIRWFGTSNGYYSESVSFDKIK